MTVNLRLQKALDDRGYSHEEAAKLCGKSTQWIGRRVRGESRINDKDLKLMCGKLDLTADQVLDIPIMSRETRGVDSMLIDTPILFVREEAAKAKRKATNKQLSAWATLVFSVASELGLNLHEVKTLARLVVRSGLKA